jgi:hypothetical protein
MDSTRSASIESVQANAGTQRVCALSTHNCKETRATLNAVRALGHEPIWIRDENVISWIQEGTVQLSPRVDLLVNRTLLTKSDHQLEDLQPAARHEETTPVVDPQQAVAKTLHEYHASAKLAGADLPVPDAIFGRSPRAFDEWPKYLPDAAAQKHTIGTNGQDMSVVSSSEPVGPPINDEHAFVQELLEDSDDRPSDVRVHVVGGEVVGAMRRHAPEGDWRTVTACITDRSGMAYPALLGRDVPEAYTLDISHTVED